MVFFSRIGRTGAGRGKAVAVHYSADTSRYVVGHHEHYEGVYIYA